MNTTLRTLTDEAFGYVSMYNQLKAWHFLYEREREKETRYGKRVSNTEVLRSLLFRKGNYALRNNLRLSPQIVSLVEGIRSYQELLPLDDHLRELGLLTVSDETLEACVPYNGIQYAHSSSVYQPIDTKKVTEAFIERGIYPVSVGVLKRKKSPSLFADPDEQQRWESQRYHIVRFIDHATMTTDKYGSTFSELFGETDFLPVIELHNAHDGKHACFMILSMINPFDNNKNKTNIYPNDADDANPVFGVRLEHRNLGPNLENLDAAIVKIASGYSKLYKKKYLLESYKLNPKEKSVLLKEIETLLFKNQHLKDWNWTPLFDGWRSKDGKKKTDDDDDWNLWNRLIHIQEVLYSGVSYTIIDKNGKEWKKKKKLENQSLIENEYNQRKIYGYLFNLFVRFAEERKKK